MTAQVATTFPEPPVRPQYTNITANVAGSAVAFDMRKWRGEIDQVEFSFPEWTGRLTKAEALDAIAALRTLLAAAEGALRANDKAGEREGEDQT